MKNRTQVNVRIPAQSKRKLDTERKSFAGLVTKDIIVELALEDWFTRFSPDQRRGFYKAHDRRPYCA